MQRPYEAARLVETVVAVEVSQQVPMDLLL